MAGGAVVFWADHSPGAGAAWAVLGLLIGWLGLGALESAITAIRGRSKGWELTQPTPTTRADLDLHFAEQFIGILETGPLKTWVEFVAVAAGFCGVTWGLLLGPLLGLLVAVEPGWELSAAQGALLGAVLGPAAFALLGLVVFGLCIASERRPSLAATRLVLRRAAKERLAPAPDRLGPGHLLLAILEDRDSPAARLFAGRPVSDADLRAALNRRMEFATSSSDGPTGIGGRPEDSGFLTGVILEAFNEAKRRKHPAVTNVHLLLAVIRRRRGIMAQILGELGVEIEALEKELDEMFDRQGR